MRSFQPRLQSTDDTSTAPVSASRRRPTACRTAGALAHGLCIVAAAVAAAATVGSVALLFTDLRPPTAAASQPITTG